MKCDEVETQLSALLDGELTPETTVDIETHLACCQRCSQAHKAMRTVLEIAKGWHVEKANVLGLVLQQIRTDELHYVMQEVKRLHSEVTSLHQEITDLKTRLKERDEATGRESSVLRFPYARAQTTAHHIL